MANYNPIRTPNAIDQAVFVLKVSRDMSTSFPDELRALKDLMSDVFTVKNDVTISGFEFTPDGATKPPENRFGGIELVSEVKQGDHLLVKERADWHVRIVENTIQINCLNYTSWSEAIDFVSAILNVILEKMPFENDDCISEMTLQYNDTFVAEDGLDKIDITKLFNKSKYLTDNVFASGLLWHINSGWFKNIDDTAAILNVLNISTRIERSEPAKHVVLIEHMQRYSVKVPVLPILENKELPVRVYNDLHVENKNVIKELLMTEIKSQIGL